MRKKINLNIKQVVAIIFFISMLILSIATNNINIYAEKRVSIKDIEVSNYNNELEVGNTFTLTTTIIPLDKTDLSVTYESSNKRIATVNSLGEVKGISKGNVIIYAKAGKIIKKIPIKVIVSTKKISINNTYVVMKVNESYQLVTNVSPRDADQNIRYRSLDTRVASVSEDGKIISKSSGSTSIIVSNNDTSNAVTVIVNELAVNDKENIENKKTDIKYNEYYPQLIESKNYNIITSDMLNYFYNTKKTLSILGNGYTIKIDGRKIYNYENEFLTDLNFFENKNGINFILNNDKKICGEILLEFDFNLSSDYKLYLYNTSKEKYENIKTDNINKLILDKEGKYLITDNKIHINNENKIIIILFIILTILIIIFYILREKKYWFW